MSTRPAPGGPDRVVLACSGGLDTSAAIGWIQSPAKGFIEAWGLPSTPAARRTARVGGGTPS